MDVTDVTAHVEAVRRSRTRAGASGTAVWGWRSIFRLKAGSQASIVDFFFGVGRVSPAAAVVAGSINDNDASMTAAKATKIAAMAS